MPKDPAVADLTLQVNSRWPGYDEHDLLRIAMTTEGIKEGFVCQDFVSRAPRGRETFGYGDSFVIGCTGEGAKTRACTFRVKVKPAWEETIRCDYVVEVCDRHNHDLATTDAHKEQLKVEGDAKIRKWSASIRERAEKHIERNRKAIDHRSSAEDVLERRKVQDYRQEQDLVYRSFKLLSEDVRSQLEAEHTELVLLPKKRESKVSRPGRQAKPAQAAVAARTSQAPTPEERRALKRAISSSQDPEPPRSTKRRPAPIDVAMPHDRNTADAEAMSLPAVLPDVLGRQPQQQMTPPLSNYTDKPFVDLSKSDTEDDVKPISGASSGARSRAATEAANPARALASFLDSLSPAWRFSRYQALVSGEDIGFSSREDPLGIARSPDPLDLDDLIDVLHKEGMPTLWCKAFRRSLLAAAAREED